MDVFFPSCLFRWLQGPLTLNALSPQINIKQLPGSFCILLWCVMTCGRPVSLNIKGILTSHKCNTSILRQQNEFLNTDAFFKGLRKNSIYVPLMQCGTAGLTLTSDTDIDSLGSLVLALDTQNSASEMRCGSTCILPVIYFETAPIRCPPLSGYVAADLLFTLCTVNISPPRMLGFPIGCVTRKKRPRVWVQQLTHIRPVVWNTAQ